MPHLVISRREREGLHIGDEIYLLVVGIEDGRVRLGIEAPRDIPVLREEVWTQRRAAAAAAPEDDEPSDSPSP